MTTVKAKCKHKDDRILIAGMLAVPPLLTIVPWRQNIPATGRVIALDPLDRLQTIPAPVTGRLVRVLVQEGGALFLKTGLYREGSKTGTLPSDRLHVRDARIAVLK